MEGCRSEGNDTAEQPAPSREEKIPGSEPIRLDWRTGHAYVGTGEESLGQKEHMSHRGQADKQLLLPHNYGSCCHRKITLSV
jgi:hypothetical protein